MTLFSPLCSECGNQEFCRFIFYLSELEVKLREIQGKLPKDAFKIQLNVYCKYFRKG